MASDKKKTSTPSSGNGGSVPRTKRPGRTIDLEAEDVTVEDVPAKEPSRTADKKTVSAADTKPDIRSDDDAKPDADAKPDDDTPKQTLRHRAKPADIKSFVTHLAAGLVGGLIAVIGAGMVQDPPPEPGKAPPPYDDAKLVKRLNAAETKLAALQKADPAPELRKAAGKMELRVTALEKKPPELKDMSVRLGKLESTLKTLREAGAQEGASGVAQSAALTGKIDEVSTQLETRISGLKKDMEALGNSLETRVTAQSKESGKTANDLRKLLESFEEKIASLEEKLAVTVAPSMSLSASSSGGAALALTFESLRRAVERGQPYADQLTALKDIAPEGLDLTEFEADAATGIATNAELLSALPDVLNAAYAAIETPENGTFLERVVTNARSVVRIRRIRPSEGESPSQVLSRMDAQMKAFNVAGVLREAEGLKGSVRDVIQPWKDKAMARRASEGRLEKLGQQLLGVLQAKTEKKG
jgi:hypothetical protein